MLNYIISIAGIALSLILAGCVSSDEAYADGAADDCVKLYRQVYLPPVSVGGQGKVISVPVETACD